MSYVWFNEVLTALGKRINFESISNLYGNSFAKDSAKIVNESYPLSPNGRSTGGNITQLFNNIKIIDTKNKDVASKATNKSIGDISWAINFEKPKE